VLSDAIAQMPGAYSVGFAVTEKIREAIALMPTSLWTPAVDADGVTGWRSRTAVTCAKPIVQVVDPGAHTLEPSAARRPAPATARPRSSHRC